MVLIPKHLVAIVRMRWVIDVLLNDLVHRGEDARHEFEMSEIATRRCDEKVWNSGVEI